MLAKIAVGHLAGIGRADSSLSQQALDIDALAAEPAQHFTEQAPVGVDIFRRRRRDCLCRIGLGAVLRLVIILVIVRHEFVS